jgi:hypothetical protein
MNVTLTCVAMSACWLEGTEPLTVSALALQKQRHYHGNVMRGGNSTAPELTKAYLLALCAHTMRHGHCRACYDISKTVSAAM